MDTEILGIVGHIMYLAPFYGGDNYHDFTITKYQKETLLERGVKEYPSFDYIEAMLHGMTYDAYSEMRASQEEYREIQADLRSKSISEEDDDNLPF